MRYFALVGLIISAGVLLFFRSPDRPGSYGYCPLYYATGLYCPGCGTVRGLHRLLHGDLAGAIGFNALMVVSLPFLVIAFIRYTLRVCWPDRFSYLWIPPRLIWGLLILVVLFGVVRNLPIRPFTLLAPHDHPIARNAN